MSDYWFTEHEKARELLVREWEPIWGRPCYVRGTYRVSPDDVASWLLSQDKTVRDSVLERVGSAMHVDDLEHANRLITDLGRQLEDERQRSSVLETELSKERQAIITMRADLDEKCRRARAAGEALREALLDRRDSGLEDLQSMISSERSRANRAEETLKAILELIKK